jgi:hypothetical protein
MNLCGALRHEGIADHFPAQCFRHRMAALSCSSAPSALIGSRPFRTTQLAQRLVAHSILCLALRLQLTGFHSHVLVRSWHFVSLIFRISRAKREPKSSRPKPVNKAFVPSCQITASGCSGMTSVASRSSMSPTRSPFLPRFTTMTGCPRSDDNRARRRAG